MSVRDPASPPNAESGMGEVPLTRGLLGAAVFDGVYTRATPIRRPIFHGLSRPPTRTSQHLSHGCTAASGGCSFVASGCRRTTRGATRSRRRNPSSRRRSRPRYRAAWPSARGPGRYSGASARPPALRRPPHGVPDSKASACTLTWRCRHAAGISWSGWAGTSTRSPVGPGRSSHGSSRTFGVGDGWDSAGGALRGPGPRRARRLQVRGRILHDFRRMAIRDLERAGVPRSVAMKRHRQRRGPPRSDRAGAGPR
jgi:hypothetical protein